MEMDSSMPYAQLVSRHLVAITRGWALKPAEPLPKVYDAETGFKYDV